MAWRCGTAGMPRRSTFIRGAPHRACELGRRAVSGRFLAEPSPGRGPGTAAGQGLGFRDQPDRRACSYSKRPRRTTRARHRPPQEPWPVLRRGLPSALGAVRAAGAALRPPASRFRPTEPRPGPGGIWPGSLPPRWPMPGRAGRAGRQLRRCGPRSAHHGATRAEGADGPGQVLGGSAVGERAKLALPSSPARASGQGMGNFAPHLPRVRPGVRRGVRGVQPGRHQRAGGRDLQ